MVKGGADVMFSSLGFMVLRGLESGVPEILQPMWIRVISIEMPTQEPTKQASLEES